MADDDPIGKPVVGLLVVDQGAILVLLAMLARDGDRPRLPMDGLEIGSKLIHRRDCLGWGLASRAAEVASLAHGADDGNVPTRKVPEIRVAIGVLTRSDTALMSQRRLSASSLDG